MRITTQILLVLVFLGGTVLLQVWLSRREGRWPGLVLPVLAFLGSLACPLFMLVPADGVTVGFVVQMVLVWLLANIPTAVLLAIYFACREKRRRKKQLERMNMQDLG